MAWSMVIAGREIISADTEAEARGHCDRLWTDHSNDYWRSGYAMHGALNQPATYWAEGSTDYSYTRDIIEAIEALGSVGSVLELGCNAGRNLYGIGCHFGESLSLAGIDINPAAVTVARSNLEGFIGADVQCGDLTDPATLGGLETDSIDVVFSMYVLAHIPPGEMKARILDEARRIARVAVVLIEPHQEAIPDLEIPTSAGAPTSSDNYRRYGFDVVKHLPMRLAGNPADLMIAEATI